MLPHECVVTGWMSGRQTYVLVEIECGDAAKIETLLAVHANEFPVHRQRGGAGGEAEDGVPFFAHDPGDVPRGDDRALFGSGLDDDFHAFTSRGVCRVS